MQLLPPSPATGTVVEARGQAWRVTRSQPFERCALVTLQGVGTANLGERLRLLTPFDRLRPHAGDGGMRRVRRQPCLRRVARGIAEAHPWNGLWTAGGGRLELLPWQLEPALAVLEGASRVLLADGVGLGKTVQAGLILAELQARGLVERALVLTPAGLRRQWLQELRDRFDVTGVELDQPALARASASLPVGANPWASAPVVVSSIDLVKRPEHAAAIDQVDFDLLIVDEAHHVTPGTDRGALVARLAHRCAWTVMVTATPHSGDEHAFAFLHALGATGHDPLTIFRRGPDEMTRASSRRTRLCAVAMTPAEATLAAAVEAYARTIWRECGATSESARLVATLVARRAASSAAALLRTLERRRLLTGGGSQPAQSALPWEEPDERDEVEPDTLLRVPGLADGARERAVLDRLIALAHEARVEPSKTMWIARWLRRTNESIVVFSEYRDTVEELARALATSHVAVIHGGLSPAERRRALARFAGGHARVLLTTDAAGEGLNLQHGCRAVINVELPWNPVRLEQRVGRVDRLGQQRTVHAVHLFHAGTIEDRVLARLHRRVARASAMGDHLWSVMGTAAIRAVAAAALGNGEPLAPRTCALSSRAVAHARRETDRLVLSRRLRALAAAPGRAGPDTLRRASAMVAPQPDGRRARVMWCLFESMALDARGRLLGRCVVPLAARLRAPAIVTRATACRAARTLADHEGLTRAAQEAATARLEDGAASARRGASSWLKRVCALRDAVEAAAPAMFQASLFDRRALSVAAARAARRAAQLAHLARLVEAIEALTRARIAEPVELIAVWPVHPEPSPRPVESSAPSPEHPAP